MCEVNVRSLAKMNACSLLSIFPYIPYIIYSQRARLRRFGYDLIAPGSKKGGACAGNDKVVLTNLSRWQFPGSFPKWGDRNPDPHLVESLF